MSTPSARSLTAVMTTYNQWALTERCLESLLTGYACVRSENGEIPLSRLIVVENVSQDETRSRLPPYRSRLLEYGIELVIDESKENLGFAKGMNRGIELALALGQPEYVAVLNNDTYLMPEWDTALIRALERHGADVVSPYVLEEPFTEGTPERLQTVAEKNRGRKRRQWSMILGLFRTEALKTVGMFDPIYFVGYEDADLKHRMDLARRKYFTVGDCVIWHKSKGTRGEDSAIERFGLEKFIEKWGFDPRAADHTRLAKLRNSWRKFKSRWDYL